MSSSDNGGSNNNQNQKKKWLQGTCNYCRKFGYKEADCHKKAVDHKKENKKAAAVAMLGSNVEFLVCVKTEFGCMVTGSTEQSFPDSHKLLTQPMIWIGDMVATMDMMPQDIGMINKQISKESGSIVMGNKQIEKLVAVGDIPSIVCNNQGHHVIHVTMKDVAFIPGCAFNLFQQQSVGVDKPRWKIFGEIWHHHFHPKWSFVCNVYCKEATGSGQGCDNQPEWQQES